jgi:hypothetical protein
MTEEELEQLSEDWPRMRAEISNLKSENRELKDGLGKLIILVRSLYAYEGTDKTSMRAENLRNEIVKLLGELHTSLEVPPP